MAQHRQPNVALWTHVIRRRDDGMRTNAARRWFRGRVASAAITSDSRGETLMVNELYLSVVYRPIAGTAAESHRARLLTSVAACAVTA